MTWVLRWETYHPFYRMEALFEGHKKALALGSDYSGLFGHSENNAMRMYYPSEDLERKGVEGLSILSDKKKVHQYVTDVKRNINSLMGDLKHFQATLTDEELAKFYQEIISKLEYLLCSYDLSRPEFFEKIDPKLRESVSEEEFQILGTACEPTILDIEQTEFLQLINDEGIDISKKLEEHAKKYGWIGTSEQSKPWTVSYYKRRLEYEKHNPPKTIDKEKILRKQRELSNKIPSEINSLFEMVRLLTHLRLEIRLTWVETGYLLGKFFEEVSKRREISVEDLKNYRLSEMVELIKFGNKINVENRNQYAFLLREGKITLFTGSDVDTVIRKELSEENFAGIDRVSGNVANPGIVVGKVRVINSLTKDQDAEMAKMEPGEILITGMTRPHLMAALRKCSAIVTDEGGLTSHASIVSRELGKPCIVATKIATKVFKTGDLVEVDADHGIVRKK